MKKIALHWQILTALLLAILFGFFCPSAVKYFEWMGVVFLKALKMIVLPLILTSIITGVAQMSGEHSLGRLGLKTFFYYIITSTVAIFTGLAIVNIIRPGIHANLSLSDSSQKLAVESLSFSDILTGIIPDNIFNAMANGEVLPVIFFALLLGYFITKTKASHQRILIHFFDAFYEAMMKMTLFIIKFTPLGIFALVSVEVARNADKLSSIAGSLMLYMLTVVAGLLVHAFVILPALVRFVGKSKPYSVMRKMASVLLTAFSTSSSSATLPLTIDSIQNRVGVSGKISGFVLPLGATVNMDGTALYECVAAMFIAQAYGIDLSFGMQLIIVVTALLTSIGAAGIPMAGLVMISIILTAVHLPMEGIGLILAVDRILDMMRTTVNVWSDTCGTVIIARSEGEELTL